MPPDLVVKKALNSRSAFSAEIPTPQSVTLTSTCRVSSWRDWISSSRGRSVTDCIASIPFIAKLIITCCSWTRSPRIMGRAGASSVRNDTRWLNSSCCTSVMVSLATSLISSGTFSMSDLFASERTRRITSLARLPSPIIHSTERRAPSRSGVSRFSQRRQASALATIPASGWFTSWAMEAVSSPSVVTRITCARFACVSRNAPSTCLRCVRSSTKATPWSWRSPNVVEPSRTGTRLPSLRKYSFSRGWAVPVAFSSAMARSSASRHSTGVSSVHRSRPETRSSRAYPTISRKALLASMIRP